MNRVITILLIIFIVNISESIAHDVPHYTIKERTENADIIFEGEVLSSVSMWSENRRLIYTKHEVRIEKLFKGRWRETTITIYTKGGEAEGEIHMHTHDASLSIGFKGIFFGITDPYRNIKDENFKGVRLLYESSGFIRYTDNNVGIKASDHYRGFKSISAVHDSIVLSTRQPILTYENGIIPDFSLAPCPPISRNSPKFFL